MQNHSETLQYYKKIIKKKKKLTKYMHKFHLSCSHKEIQILMEHIYYPQLDN
jgi:hypothetical protein